MNTLPIAEIFISPQGEGFWAGSVMGFIRLAGCSVGRPYLKREIAELGLQPYQERCIAWDGNSFACDTNFKMSKKLTPAEIMSQVPGVERVCITGGEPLMHDITELIACAKANGKKIHIETSGTIALDEIRAHKPLWVTVSPKENYIRDVLWEASELKILVGNNFNEKQFVDEFADFISTGKVWLQPVNFETQINPVNMQKCVEMAHKYPLLRISLQNHKIMGVR